MWPESVTFSPKSIKFSEDLYKWWRNSYTKFGAAARRRFFAILKKPQGGADTRPPAGARVKTDHTTGKKKQYDVKNTQEPCKPHIWSITDNKQL